MWLALLRGINVGGHKKIKMAELKALFVSLGFTDVVSYIQSGNLIFNAPELRAPEIIERITTAIEQTYAFHVPVILRQIEDLQVLIEQRPLHFEGLKSVYVCFFSEAPQAELLEGLKPFCTRSEQFQLQLQGKALYLDYPQGCGQSKLNNNLIERKLNCVATTRNWNTVLKLSTLLSQ